MVSSVKNVPQSVRDSCARIQAREITGLTRRCPEELAR
jgi:hypothetical protein